MKRHLIYCIIIAIYATIAAACSSYGTSGGSQSIIGKWDITESYMDGEWIAVPEDEAEMLYMIFNEDGTGYDYDLGPITYTYDEESGIMTLTCDDYIESWNYEFVKSTEIIATCIDAEMTFRLVKDLSYRIK